MLVGYIRVSSDSDRQTTDWKRDELLGDGVDSHMYSRITFPEQKIIVQDWSKQ